MVAVTLLYQDRVMPGNESGEMRAGMAELLLSQRIGTAISDICQHEPERAAAFAARLDFYERRLDRLKMGDKDLARFSSRRKVAGPTRGLGLRGGFWGP